MAGHRSSRLAAFALAGTFVAVLVLLAPLASSGQPGELTCDQEPGNRFFWLERAFCDLPLNGPERAVGIVIWNHGISGSTHSWRAPAPPAFRLLQARGWDVIMLKRHHAAETMPGSTLLRTVQRTLEEAAASRKLGYRKVALAGQSFGGYVSLEAVDTSPDLDAVVAFAPGVRPSGATGALDPSITDRILRRAKVGRIAVVFPKNDELFGYLSRGEVRKPSSRTAACPTSCSTRRAASADMEGESPGALPCATVSASRTSSAQTVHQLDASRVPG